MKKNTLLLVLLLLVSTGCGHPDFSSTDYSIENPSLFGEVGRYALDGDLEPSLLGKNATQYQDGLVVLAGSVEDDGGWLIVSLRFEDVRDPSELVPGLVLGGEADVSFPDVAFEVQAFGPERVWTACADGGATVTVEESDLPDHVRVTYSTTASYYESTDGGVELDETTVITGSFDLNVVPSEE